MCGELDCNSAKLYGPQESGLESPWREGQPRLEAVSEKCDFSRRNLWSEFCRGEPKKVEQCGSKKSSRVHPSGANRNWPIDAPFLTPSLQVLPLLVAPANATSPSPSRPPRPFMSHEARTTLLYAVRPLRLQWLSKASWRVTTLVTLTSAHSGGLRLSPQSSFTKIIRSSNATQCPCRSFPSVLVTER
jgi:hypothetical protein